jgi:hypothetical protein
MPFGNDSTFPLHDDAVRRWAQRGYMTDFLRARMSVSRSFEQHDFNRSVTADVTNNWSVQASSTATTWAMLAEAGGWIRGVTGASVATGAVGLFAPNKMWTGTSGAGFASLIRLSAITDVRLEQGFADVLPANGTTMVNLASNAFSSTVNAAVYLYDHLTASVSVTTTGLYTVGTSVAFSAVATTTNRYASGVTLFVALEVDGTTCKLWVGPPSGGPLAVKHAGVTAGTGMVPFINAVTASGSKNVDVDAIWTWTLGRV